MRSPATPQRAARRLLILLPVLLAAVTGCAAPGSEIHLAPFYSRHATALGTVETEALGGMVHRIVDEETGTPLVEAVKPFYGWRNEGGGDWSAEVLSPLGLTRRRDGELLSFLVPLYIYRIGDKLDGTRESRLIALPGLMARSNSERGLSVGWFPFVGKLETFLTYDDVFFFLFPLYSTVRAGERKSTHILYPLIGWTTGGGESSFHLWPLFSRAKREGRYERYALLWPFLQYHRNFLGGGGEEPETVWWIWPLYGRTQRGTYTAHTTLWPLFGYASDPARDYWSFDAFAPLIRFERGGENTPVVERSRIWPLAGYVEADRMRYWTFLWPLGHHRQERYVDSKRDSWNLIPFWQSWDREELRTGRKSAWRKLWPLYQWERDGDLTRGSFPTLDPLQRNRVLHYHYGWTWRVWSWESQGDMQRRRAWLDVYRREDDANEKRRSLAFLWANRKYDDADGDRTSETSILFGLLRWRRNEADGFDMLAPAFPGPGWPAERAAPPEASLGGKL